MEYKGKLYAKINGKYIECTESVEQLENRIKELENQKRKLEFMVENGLGAEDMKNDCI